MHLTQLPKDALHNVLVRLTVRDIFALANTSNQLTNALSSYLAHTHIRLERLCANDRLLVPRATAARHLRYVTLTALPRQSDLARLARRCPHLRALSLTVSLPVSAPTWRAFLRALARTLRQLHVSFSPSTPSRPFLIELRHCTHLSSLSLHRASFVQPARFASLLSAIGARLRVLTLDSCVRLDDAVVRHVAQHCPALQQLCVAASDHVSDDALYAIAQSSCAQTLTRLQITSCCQITDLAVVSIAVNCTNLLHLNISQLYLTNYAVRAVAEALGPTLQVLVMGESPGIGDQALYSIAQNCDALLRLEMCALENITDHGLVSLFSPAARQHLPLQSISIDRCTSLSDASVLYICGIGDWNFSCNDLYSCPCCAFYHPPSHVAASRNERWHTETDAALQGLHVKLKQLKYLSALGKSDVAHSTWRSIRKLRPDLELRHDPSESCESDVDGVENDRAYRTPAYIDDDCIPDIRGNKPNCTAHY